MPCRRRSSSTNASRDGAGGGTWWRRNCGARAPEAIRIAGRGRARRRSSRASSKAIDRAHAVAEEGEGAVEVGIDIGGQRGDQRAHAFEGRFGEARFAAGKSHGDGGPAGDTREAVAVPPPAWGKQKSRGSADAWALGNQAAGSACLRRRRARSLRFSGERVSSTGPGRGRRSDRRLFSSRRSRIFSKWPA